MTGDRRARLGRFGPRVSQMGLRWQGDRPPGRVRPDIDWVVAAVGDAPPAAVLGARSLVVDGVQANNARAQLTDTCLRTGRDAVDVALLHATPGAEEEEWDDLVGLADDGLARCIGIVTDDPRSVERCETRRHVDAVWARASALLEGDALVRVCRWSGTGLLTGVSGPVEPALFRRATAVAVPPRKVLVPTRAKIH